MGRVGSWWARVRRTLAAFAMLAVVGGLSGCALFGGSKEKQSLDPRYRAVLDAQKARAGAAPTRPSTPARDGKTFQEKLAEGDRQRSAGQDSQALFTYLEALRMKPKDPAARERIGLLHLRQDPERSESIFRGILRTEPDSAAAQTGLGLALLAQGRAEEARPPLERAIELDPDSAMALSALGVVCDQLGDPASGRHYQQLAAERRPGDPSILNNLGASCLLDGDLECAEGAFREALILDPQDPTLHNNLGLALARQRRYGEAMDSFRKGGSEQAALNNLGWAHYLNGEHDAAVAQYEKALLVQGDEGTTVKVLDNLKVALAARSRASAPSPVEPGAEAPPAAGAVAPAVVAPQTVEAAVPAVVEPRKVEAVAPAVVAPQITGPLGGILVVDPEPAPSPEPQTPANAR